MGREARRGGGLRPRVEALAEHPRSFGVTLRNDRMTRQEVRGWILGLLLTLIAAAIVLAEIAYVVLVVFG